MGEERQPSLKNYSYEATVVPPNTVPPTVHNPPIMPQDCRIPPAPVIPQDNIFPPPPVSYPTYHEMYHAGYPQYYGTLTSNDSITNTHHAPCPAYPDRQLNSNTINPTRGPVYGAAHPQASLGIPFRGTTENAPVPPEKGAKGPTQGSNDAGYNHAAPGISMGNIYRDLSARFINSPQSNITMMRMESLPNNPGRSKVTIELEIADI